MSLRPPPDPDEHVTVRGTMVSLDRWNPSTLPVSCVHAWGLPNRNGVVHVDGVTLHVRFVADQPILRVWAHAPEDWLGGHAGTTASSCTIA